MSRRFKISLGVITVLVATVMLLMFDVPPPPDDTQAQRRGSMPYATNFDSKTWVKATDWNAEALTARAKWWRLTVKIGSNAADSLQVKVHETYSGDWVTLSFPAEAPIGAVLALMFYGPEIDSVEVFTGTLAYCRLDYWW